MTDDKNPQDPSIEEILRSIRSIIKNKDNIHKAEADEDVLELKNIVNKESQKQNHKKQSSSSNPYVEFMKYRAHNLSPKKVQDDDTKSLISEKSAIEITNILKQFSKKATIGVKDNKKHSLTIEEFIIEMIKPELKIWLDKNLSRIVNDIVEQEIKRLVPDDGT